MGVGREMSLFQHLFLIPILLATSLAFRSSLSTLYNEPPPPLNILAPDYGLYQGELQSNNGKRTLSLPSPSYKENVSLVLVIQCILK